jgi:hypothetical protein
MKYVPFIMNTSILFIALLCLFLLVSSSANFQRQDGESRELDDIEDEDIDSRELGGRHLQAYASTPGLRGGNNRYGRPYGGAGRYGSAGRYGGYYSRPYGHRPSNRRYGYGGYRPYHNRYGIYGNRYYGGGGIYY